MLNTMCGFHLNIEQQRQSSYVKDEDAHEEAHGGQGFGREMRHD